jgi:hypothetical protein
MIGAPFPKIGGPENRGRTAGQSSIFFHASKTRLLMEVIKMIKEYLEKKTEKLIDRTLYGSKKGPEN